MIRPDDLKQMEIDQCDFEQLEKDIDEKILNKEYTLSVRN